MFYGDNFKNNLAFVYKNVVNSNSISCEHSFAAVIQEIHNANVAAGWWSDPKTGYPKDRNMGEMLMLMVSEACEVPETSIYEVMDDHIPTRRMFEVESADLFIRAADIAGYRLKNFNMNEKLFSIVDCLPIAARNFVPPVHALAIPEFDESDCDIWLMAIVRQLAAAMEAHRKKDRVNENQSYREFDYHLCMAIVTTFRLADIAQLNIVDAIYEKLLYNQKRLDHKPEARLADGGKTY
jgi:hypothetical protein